MKIKWGEAEKMWPDKTAGMGVCLLQYLQHSWKQNINTKNPKVQINKTKETTETFTIRFWDIPTHNLFNIVLELVLSVQL